MWIQKGQWKEVALENRKGKKKQKGDELKEEGERGDVKKKGGS